jgi:hypothetical protein
MVLVEATLQRVGGCAQAPAEREREREREREKERERERERLCWSAWVGVRRRLPPAAKALLCQSSPQAYEREECLCSKAILRHANL